MQTSSLLLKAFLILLVSFGLFPANTSYREWKEGLDTDCAVTRTRIHVCARSTGGVGGAGTYANLQLPYFHGELCAAAGLDS